MNNRTCSFSGCLRSAKSRGLCNGHYTQQYRGVELKPIREPDSQTRFWARVTKTESCWEWNGPKTSGGYAQFSFQGRHEYVHRLAYEWMIGDIGDGMFLDHICHNRACVNPSHLRPVTNKQNAEHRQNAQRNNQGSGVRGVYWHESSKKWRGMLRHNGKLIGIGVFQTIAEAEAAIQAKRRELFTHSDHDSITH